MNRLLRHLHVSCYFLRNTVSEFWARTEQVWLRPKVRPVAKGRVSGVKPPRKIFVTISGIYFGLHPAIIHQNASSQHQNPTNYSLAKRLMILSLFFYLYKNTKSKLILRKFIKIIAKRRQILRAKCTKFDVGWGSAPDLAGGAYSVPQTP